MKKLAVLLGIVFVLGIFTSARAAEKFAYVDLSRLFGEYEKTKSYDKDLSVKENAYTSEREKKVGGIKKLQDKMSLLKEEEKEAKRGELENQLRALQDFDRDKQTDLRKEQDEKMKEILKDIEDAVKVYSKSQGFTMVFNDRVLVYQEKSLDITDKIVEILNKRKK